MSRRREVRRPQNTPARLEALGFVLTWTKVIRTILRAVGVPSGDVDDCMQEVLLGAWTAAKEGRLAFTDPPSVRGWVRVVAARVGTKWATRRRRTVLLDGFDIAADEGDAEEPNIARDLLQELQSATTPERWDAWVMRVQGMSIEEIARVEGIPEGTVHTRVWLARRDFQEALVRERAREQGPAVQRRRLEVPPNIPVIGHASNCPHPEDSLQPITGHAWVCEHCDDYVTAPSAEHPTLTPDGKRRRGS